MYNNLLEKFVYLCRVSKLKIRITNEKYLIKQRGTNAPIVGYGVFQVDPKECEHCVSNSISVDYRLPRPCFCRDDMSIRMLSKNK